MPERIRALGDLSILRQRMLALFCSVKCPGNVIIQAYDAAAALREAGVTVIGGFHSSIERDCLDVLLRGSQPIVVCPARSLEGMRLRREWRGPLADGRLLLLSPFPEGHPRVTSALAGARNEFVTSIAEVVLVAHAFPGGKLMGLCKRVIAAGKPLWTLDVPENADLVSAGAQPIAAKRIAAEWDTKTVR